MSEPSKQQNPPHQGTVSDYSDAESLRDALNSCGCTELDWRMANLDADSTEENLEDELKRLEALRCYRILDTDRKEAFERLTALAARIFDVPICLVSLVDLGRQWFASNRGLGDVRETPRKVAFCAHAILSNKDIFIVPNAIEDERFKHNGLVTGPPNIRFYAGSPLVTPDGYKLGTLCIIDSKPRPGGLSLRDKQNLREIAGLVMEHIESTKEANEKMEKDRARMIACTAHDLITPLTSIQLNMGLLSEDKNLKKKLSEAQKEIFDNTKDCVEIMSNICQQSIRLFRGENLSNSLADLDSHKEGTIVIAKVLDSLKHIMVSFPKKVPIIMHIDDDVPPVIMGDVLCIFRSSLNFLTNACKVSEQGSIGFHVCIRNEHLVFECGDTGPGVPFEHHSDLFSDENGMNLRQDNESVGFNIGLHSVAQMISSIGGLYGYHRKSHSAAGTNQGNIFWFSIPATEPKKPSRNSSLHSLNSLSGAHHPSTKTDTICSGDFTADVKMMEEKSSTRVGSNKRKMIAVVKEVAVENIPRPSNFTADGPSKRRKCALIIDDSITIRKVLMRALSGLGYEVKQAENGLIGLEELKTTVYDIVLCDFLMPIMDGVDCIQHYREWEKNHRNWFQQFIIGLSAHADSEDAQRGIAVGMNKFVQKPLRLQFLKELIRSDELTKVSKSLDLLSLDVEVAPYLLFDEDRNKHSANDSASSSLTSIVTDHTHEPRMKCLIVEDSKSITKAMSRCVVRRGWRVCVAHDGKEGLRMLMTRPWDVVFMDDHLPIISGSVLVSRFRKWEAENRAHRLNDIFMVSADCDLNGNSDVPPGFDGTIGKPFKPSRLFSILDAAENRKNQKDYNL